MAGAILLVVLGLACCATASGDSHVGQPQAPASAESAYPVRGDARRLRDQMQRLFRATISFDRATTQGVRASNVWLDMQVASHGEFWWSVRDPSQTTLWGSWIELGEKFFEAITAAPRSRSTCGC